jgi:acyl-coenzyme A synthetase/AMP-(fatty) acid ligase
MKPIIHPEHVVHSTYPDVANIPDVDIYTFMFDRPACANYPPERSPDRIAFIDSVSGLRITYSQLKANVNQLARALKHEIGIREHDIVCFFSGNHVLTSGVALTS